MPYKLQRTSVKDASNPSALPSNGELASTDGSGAFLEVRQLGKTFGRTTVLADVDLAVRPGEIHGLVGQNGSGKSTLVKLLSGVHAADPGSVIKVNGQPLSVPPTPRELQAAGLAFVHQDLGLVDDLSVLENVCVGRYERRPFSRVVRSSAARVAVTETFATLHVDINPERPVGDLHQGDKAVVSVARALYKLKRGAGCIIFDESTQSLPRERLQDFYALVRRLAAGGTAVLMISHHLPEILTLTDKVSVLRDGRLVTRSLPTHEASEQSLAALMLGRELDATRTPAPSLKSHARDTTLVVHNLSTGLLSGVDFEAHAGEVLGVTGASYSGHEDVPYALSGALRTARGELELAGRRLELPASVLDLLDAGVALVPNERASEGLSLEETAQDNLTLPRVAVHGRRFLRNHWQVDEFTHAVQLLGITPDRRGMVTGRFSGGNQQKLLLAKWLLNRPRLLLLHEPTQAVDVGARVDILRALRRAAADGMTVVLSTIETQDLAFACDRVLVFRDGEIVEELTGAMDPTAIEHIVYPELQRAERQDAND